MFAHTHTHTEEEKEPEKEKETTLISHILNAYFGLLTQINMQSTRNMHSISENIITQQYYQ